MTLLLEETEKEAGCVWNLKWESCSIAKLSIYRSGTQICVYVKAMCEFFVCLSVSVMTDREFLAL